MNLRFDVFLFSAVLVAQCRGCASVASPARAPAPHSEAVQEVTTDAENGRADQADHLANHGDLSPRSRAKLTAHLLRNQGEQRLRNQGEQSPRRGVITDSRALLRAAAASQSLTRGRATERPLLREPAFGPPRGRRPGEPGPPRRPGEPGPPRRLPPRPLPERERPLAEHPFLLGERPLGERPLAQRPLGERPPAERPFRERPLAQRPITTQAPELETSAFNFSRQAVDPSLIVLDDSKEPVNFTYPPPQADMREVLRKFAVVREETAGFDYYDYANFRKPSANDDDNAENKTIGDRTVALGSNGLVYDFEGDRGFFSTIFHAYGKHLVLDTIPDDWWFTIVNKVALAIDKNAKKPAVRQFFVSHEGKKELLVKIPSIHIDYDWFLDQFASAIRENLNVPGYVDSIQSDFSTTQAVHRIGTNSALMSSVQEFFIFSGGILCGIPAIRMKGTEHDWRRLKEKVIGLRKVLEPINKEIGLTLNGDDGGSWWSKVIAICDQLIRTFNRNPDHQWWGDIFQKRSEHRGCGRENVMDGWFIADFLDLGSITSLDEIPSGITTVPIKFRDLSNGHEEDVALVAGIPGFNVVHDPERQSWSSVAAVHGWALLMDERSPFRNRN